MHEKLRSVLPPQLAAGIRDMQDTAGTVSFLYQGNIKEIADWLPQIDYTDLTITEPDLNEVFMHYYEHTQKGGNGHDATRI